MKIEYVSEIIHGLGESIGVNNMMADWWNEWKTWV